MLRSITVNSSGICGVSPKKRKGRPQWDGLVEKESLKLGMKE